MGEGLFDRYKDLTVSASDILGYDVAELCLTDPGRLLNQTQYTQPALYVVNALTYLQRIDTEPEPDFVLGHSLGEYAALFAAGAVTFATGLKLVKKRAEIMGQVRDGGMAALLGLDLQQVKNILQDNGFTAIDIANYNSAKQIVISGSRQDILSAQKAFETGGAKLYYPLNVSGAFHSRYMAEAEHAFKVYLEEYTFSPLKIPVISNVSARPYGQDDVKSLLTRQITSQVRWYESISYLMHSAEMKFYEIGPGDVLTKMLGFIKEDLFPMTDREILPARTSPQEPVSAPPNFSLESLLGPAYQAYPRKLGGDKLGNTDFLKAYGVKYAYVAGSMFHGISSEQFVMRMARARLLSFFGTKGLTLPQIEKAIRYIKSGLDGTMPYGMSIWHQADDPARERELIDLLIDHGIKCVEASSYIGLSEAIVYYRVKGIHLDEKRRAIAGNRLLVKVSRPETAQLFLQPPPKEIVDKLLAAGAISPTQAAMAGSVPMADDICAETDGAGPTARRSPLTLFPALRLLREEVLKQQSYTSIPRLGISGGIGTPEAAAASFLVGADFILTGSVNQCTIEAGISDTAKEMLQEMNVQDTDYVPGGEMFEFGAKIQVLKKGIFFPARAGKLYELYKQYGSIDEIDRKDRAQLEDRYFKSPLETVYQHLEDRNDKDGNRPGGQNQKHKMALIFKSYFSKSIRAALDGSPDKLDYQIHTSAALGAFNQWVKATPLKEWKYRHPDEIAWLLMEGAAVCLEQFYHLLIGPQPAATPAQAIKTALYEVI